MSEDSRFAVFDFEEDLFLDPIDIFGHEAIELLKVFPSAVQESGLLQALPASASASQEEAAAVGVVFHSEASVSVAFHPEASAPTAAGAKDAKEDAAAPRAAIEKHNLGPNGDAAAMCGAVGLHAAAMRGAVGLHVSMPKEDAAATCGAVGTHVPMPNEDAAAPRGAVAPMPNEDGAASGAPPSAADPSLLTSDRLQRCVRTMSSKVEQLQREVLQATRARAILKKAKLQRSILFKDHDAGSPMNKKPRLLDAARTEAVKRKKISDLLRQCGSILRQLTQHKWAWPFMLPVDVEGLQLHDYYKIIRRPMDLGTIRSRLEAKDGTGYRNVREFCEDVRLVFRNAMLYNDSWTEVHIMAKALLQKFEDRWKVSVEPRLAEEEERLYEDQQDTFLSDIAELHASEEQAAEQLRTNVLFQLTDAQTKLDTFLMQVLSKCRPMRVEEKKDLYSRLCNLPPSSLTRVAEIVLGKDDPDATTDNVFVDLEVLDDSTLWRLHFFMKMLTDNAEEQVESKNGSSGLSNAS